jgi:hypothetical protein
VADWQTLIGSTIEQDIARKRANPGVQNFSKLVETAMNLRLKKAEESRTEASNARTAARTAVYGKYPQMAAKDLGMDTSQIPAPGTIPQGPPGTTLSKVQYDEQGNPTTVYENPTMNPPGGGASWGQAQKVEALKSGLRMGKVVIGKEFGEPSIYNAKSMEEALAAIQEAGLDPSLFSEELKLYDVVEERSIPIKVGGKRTQRIAQKLRDGRIIWADNKELIQ